jgi:uncharacterized protein YxeA
MKKILFIILICLLAGCATKHLAYSNNGKQHVFLLRDNDVSKFHLWIAQV